MILNAGLVVLLGSFDGMEPTKFGREGVSSLWRPIDTLGHDLEIRGRRS